MLILAGIADINSHDWSYHFRLLKGIHYFWNAERDIDMQVASFKLPEDQIPAKETKEERAVRARAEHITTLQLQAPRYDRTGVHGGWVNPDCKPYDVIRRLILDLSAKGQTVLDFFSGGMVLKASLLLHRECIAFSSTPKEHLFLISYPNYLREHPFVAKFWSRTEANKQR